MSPAQIPGMYYDEAKKKYFAIPKAGAVPKELDYSAESLRKRQIEGEEVAAKLNTLTMNEKRIKRLEFSPLQADSLHRETGRDPRGNYTDILKAFTQEFGGAGAGISRAHWDRFKVNYRFPAPKNAQGVTPVKVAKDTGFGCFSVCMEYRKLLYAYDDFPSTLLMSTLDPRTENDRTRGSWNPQIDTLRPTLIAQGGQSGLRTIEYNPSHRFVIATWYGETRSGNVYLNTFRPDGSFGGDLPFNLATGTPSFRYGLPKDAYGFIGCTINATAVAPTSSNYAFVLGGDAQLILLVSAEGDICNRLYRQIDDSRKPRERSEIMSMDFMTGTTYGLNTILVGHRSGVVDLLDLRERDSTTRRAGEIVHPTSVVSAKQTADNQLVVAGFKDTMCIYDLRFTRRLPLAQASGMYPSSFATCYGRSAAQGWCNKPIIAVIEHKNEYRHGLGLTVDRDTGIIAAAQDDGVGNPIKLFNSANGELIREISPAEAVRGETSKESFCKQIRWVNDDPSGESMMKSLWFSHGDGLYTCRTGDKRVDQPKTRKKVPISEPYMDGEGRYWD